MKEQAHTHLGPQKPQALSHPSPTMERPMAAPPPTQEGQKVVATSQNLYDPMSIEQVIKWMHAVCIYPVNTTCIK